jgi:hypothetical protein
MLVQVGCTQTQSEVQQQCRSDATIDRPLSSAILVSLNIFEMKSVLDGLSVGVAGIVLELLG